MKVSSLTITGWAVPRELPRPGSGQSHERRMKAGCWMIAPASSSDMDMKK
jgi:hypothetical protein